MEQTHIPKVGAIVLNHLNNDEILLLYRKQQKDWSFPKGRIEKGEDALTAMIREIKEETGLDVNLVKELPLLQYPHDNGSLVMVRMFLVGSQVHKIRHPFHQTVTSTT